MSVLKKNNEIISGSEVNETPVDEAGEITSVVKQDTVIASEDWEKSDGLDENSDAPTPTPEAEDGDTSGDDIVDDRLITFCPVKEEDNLRELLTHPTESSFLEPAHSHKGEHEHSPEDESEPPPDDDPFDPFKDEFIPVEEEDDFLKAPEPDREPDKEPTEASCPTARLYDVLNEAHKKDPVDEPVDTTIGNTDEIISITQVKDDKEVEKTDK